MSDCYCGARPNPHPHDRDRADFCGPTPVEIPLDHTADGVQITLGLRVWTNDLDRATVVAPPRYGDGWWEVLTDGRERPDILDGSRMGTRHPSTREKA